MGNSNDIKKGIKSCYYAYEGRLKYAIQSGAELFIQAKKHHKFYLDENATELFGENTVNRKATAQDAKWAFIFDMLFQKAVATPDNEIYPLWGDIGTPSKGRSIAKMGIANQYKSGPSIAFVPVNEEDIWLGRKYRVEVFNEIPNAGFYFYFIPVGFPSIRFAYFEKQVITESTTKVGINEGYYSYGQTHILYLNTHLLPITVLPQNFKPQELGITMEMDAKHLQLEIYLTDEQFNNLLEKPIVKEELMQFYKTTVGANGQFEIPVLIDPEWKDKIHPKAEKIKSYSFTLQIKNTKTGITYPKAERFKVRLSGLKKINEDYTDYESFDVSPNLLVKYESQEEILRNYEVAKTNQIQYIGDIEYSVREFDPCGYSKITVKEGERKYDVFNEEALTVSDKTDTFFDIIRPDIDPKAASKAVEILVSKLKTENVFCQSVLLDKNQKHNDIHNVFNIKEIWISKQLFSLTDAQQNQLEESRKQKKDNLTVHQPIDAPIDKQKSQSSKPDGNYNGSQHEYEEDKTHIGDTGLAFKDYDLKNVIKVKGASVLNWTEGRDYKLSKEGEVGAITLKSLYYIYNKEAFGKSIMASQFWQFRYFWLSDALAQHYFIPVSTCRYPNQLAQIRVFPDMEWEVFVLIVPVDSLAYGTGNMEYSPQKSQHERKEKAAYKSSDANLVDYKVELHIKSTIKGNIVDVSLGLEQKIGEYLKAVQAIKDVLDILSHKNEVVKGAGAKAQAMVAKIGKKGVSPFFLDFSLPSLRVGGSWRFDIPNGEIVNKIETIGSIDIAFQPLLKAKGGIDLIAAMHYIPVVGEILIAIEIIKGLTEMTISAFTPFEVSSSLWFNFYGFGQIDVKLSFDFFNAKNRALEPKTTFGVGIELGLKIEATVKKVIFTNGLGDRETVGGIGGELSGKAETGLEFKARLNQNNYNRIAISGSVSFLGITLEVVGKMEVVVEGDSKKKPPGSKGKFPFCDRIDDFAKFNWELK